MACANHSLQSYFFQKEFFGELIVLRHLNMDFTIFFNVILTDLSKLSVSFKTKTELEGKKILSRKHRHVLLCASARIIKI